MCTEKGIVTTELEGNPNSPRKTVNRIVGKHTTHNSSIYSDDEDDGMAFDPKQGRRGPNINVKKSKW